MGHLEALLPHLCVSRLNRASVEAARDLLAKLVVNVLGELFAVGDHVVEYPDGEAANLLLFGIV